MRSQARSHAQLLAELRRYIDEYVQYLDHCTDDESRAVNADLQGIIAALERLLTQPHQQADAERLAKQVRAHLRHLQDNNQTPQPSTSAQRRTLRQAFQDYITEEIRYVSATAGALRREQSNALLSGMIADLKALASHPSDQQARMLTADLEAKRDQLTRLVRPWQRLGEQQAR